MKLFTKTIHEQLLRNGRIQAQLAKKPVPAEARSERYADFLPIVKLFTPDANCTWLLTELDPDAPEIAFGLCDLGMGFPELGNVSIAELSQLRGKLGLPVERDRHFAATHTISVYADAARMAQRITENGEALAQAAAAKAGENS